jgi:hypothetical protein
MPSGDGRWAELSSMNERVSWPGDPDASQEFSTAQARARWAELDSSGERLVDAAGPLSGAVPSRGATAMRLVASAA